MPRSRREAFALPPGAIVRTIRPDIKALALPVRIYTPGLVIANFTVLGRAVPWSVSRRGTKSPRLIDWQRQVRKAAVEAMDGRRPHAGPFAFAATFELIRRGTMADSTNLQKSSEDACQGVVIVNDSMCRQSFVTYDPDAPIDRTYICLMAL